MRLSFDSLSSSDYQIDVAYNGLQWQQSVHFVDTQSAQENEYLDEKEEENIMRMSFSFRRAASAMLTTQATTC